MYFSRLINSARERKRLALKTAKFGRAANEFRKFIQRTFPTQDAITMGIVLCLLQALDGVFTSIGVSRFGTEIEGNPFLKELMLNLGYVEAITIFKILSISAIILLVKLSFTFSWVGRTMEAICYIYIMAAILPWTYFLFVKPYI